MSDSIKVAIRVRPFNALEKSKDAKACVEVDGQQVKVYQPEPNQNEEPKQYAFHRCYWSTDDSMGYPPINNNDIFEDIGKDILNHVYQGYDATIFAYGQTGSGKSFSIEGIVNGNVKGILQMSLDDIFLRKMVENKSNAIATTVQVHYF